MQRLRNYGILSLTIVALVFPSSTTGSEQPQGSSSPAPKFRKAQRAIPNRYIVGLNDDVVSDKAPLEVRRARVTAIANSHAQTYGGKVDYIYETALKGYAIELPNEAAAIAISNLPEVNWVEEDAVFEVDRAPVSSKSIGLPGSSKDTGSVCRGKTIAVSPLGPELHGRRMPIPNCSITEPGRFVIRDRDEFYKLWQRMTALCSDKLPLPEVDFSREMMVVAAMGQQPSPGYGITIDGACEVNNQLEVSVRSTTVQCGGQLGVMTSPLDIARVPKTDLPVVFRETKVTSDCKDLLRP